MSSNDPRNMLPSAWTGKIRRTKSTGVMANHNHTSNTLHHETTTTTPSPSPPTTTSSPSPPPKKAWERHYRSFLKKKTTQQEGEGGNDPQDTTTTNSTTSIMIEDTMTTKSTFRLVPGSRRLLVKPPPQPPQLFSSGMIAQEDGNDITSTGTTTTSSLFSSMEDFTSTKSDLAIRGGSFFHSVFHHHQKQSPQHHQPQHRKIKSADTLAHSQLQHRRTTSKSSADDLDSTLRRGQGKTLSPRSSPKNVRFMPPPDPNINLDTPIPPPPPPPSSSIPTAFRSTQRPTARSQLALTLSLDPTNTILLVKEPPAAESVAADPPVAEPAPPAPLSAKKAQSSEIKKAFTEYHNSTKFAQDSTSAYLGDEPSAHQQHSYFAQFNPMARANMSERFQPNLSIKNSLSRSVPLETVTEDICVHRSITMLRTIQGPESWQAGRRYLIAPAALSSCPLSVLSTLSGVTAYKSIDESAFGRIPLGRANLTYVGQRKMTSSITTMMMDHPLPQGWSICDLVLQQNYLLEYDVDAGMHGIPRAVVHLQHARAYPGDFATSVELEFFGSPCAKADKRLLLMQLDSKEERERWVTCLNDAALLTIQDLYSYDEDSPFGRGRYAAVYPARRLDKCSRSDCAGTEPNCAIKVIDKNEFWKRVVKGMERADTLVRETSVQATLTAKCGRLPSFLQLKSFFETTDNVVLELELLEGTDLFHYISTRGTLDETEAANIMKDILTSLDSMSRIGLAHRDIKPANILMANKEKDRVNVKIGDFGMSAFVGVDGLVRGRCGTPGYVAPEIFTAGIHGGYGNKVDVFSAGVTLYVMLCGYEPFYGETDAELIAANKEADVDYPDSDWNLVSREARDLVEKMLMQDPHTRISAKAALQHPWILSNASDSYDDILDASSSLKASDISTGTACTIC